MRPLSQQFCARCAELSESCQIGWSPADGPAHRVRKRLKSLGWEVVQPWEWRHPSFNFNLSLDPSSAAWSHDHEWVGHLLREAWRWHWLGKYMRSGHHEIVEFGPRSYPKVLLEHTRELAGNASKNDGGPDWGICQPSDAHSSG